MPDFNRPTFAQIFARVQADIEGEVVGVTTRVRRRVERGFAFAHASVSHGLHGHLAWIADQILPDTAAARFLLRWCALFGISQQPAGRAQGFILVSGTGGDMPIGTQWSRAGVATRYETLVSESTIIAPRLVTVRAVTGGAEGNLTTGASVALVIPVANVAGTATVGPDGLTDGTPIESLGQLLKRLLRRIQRPTLGGAPTDHETWAEEVAGVSRSWEYRGTNGIGNPGLGRVALTFVCDEQTPSIIPSGPKVAEVLEHVQSKSTAEVIVFAPTAVPLELEIDLTPNTAAVQAQVLTAIKEMIEREAEPGTTLPLSRITEAISSAVGETDHELISPTENVEPAFGEIIVYDAGSITFPA